MKEKRYYSCFSFFSISKDVRELSNILGISYDICLLFCTANYICIKLVMTVHEDIPHKLLGMLAEIQ